MLQTNPPRAHRLAMTAMMLLAMLLATNVHAFNWLPWGDPPACEGPRSTWHNCKGTQYFGRGELKDHYIGMWKYGARHGKGIVWLHKGDSAGVYDVEHEEGVIVQVVKRED